MSDLKQFQDEHGERWNEITNDPAFGAAMSLLNLAKMQEISILTNEEIAANAPTILSGLRDHLRHENDLYTIGTKPDLNFRGSIPETYTDPLKELEPVPEPPKTEQPLKPAPKRKRK